MGLKKKRKEIEQCVQLFINLYTYNIIYSAFFYKFASE